MRSTSPLFALLVLASAVAAGAESQPAGLKVRPESLMAVSGQTAETQLDDAATAPEATAPVALVPVIRPEKPKGLIFDPEAPLRERELARPKTDTAEVRAGRAPGTGLDFGPFGDGPARRKGADDPLASELESLTRPAPDRPVVIPRRPVLVPTDRVRPAANAAPAGDAGADAEDEVESTAPSTR